MNITPEIQAAIDAAVQAATAPLTEQIEALQSQADLTANPPDLADLAAMSEDQLAELGLTADEVNEAIEAHNAEVEAEGLADGQGDGSDDQGDEAGEFADAGTPAAAATGLQSVLAEVRELGAQLRRAKAGREAAEQEQILTELSARYDDLIAQNVELQAAVASGGHAASHGATTVQFQTKAGTTINFGTKEAGVFEELVAAHLDENPKDTKSVAFSAVIRSNPDAYQDYRVRRGLVKG